MRGFAMAEETTITTNSVEETKRLGREVAHALQGSENLLLVGELGSGKTAFAQGLAEGLAIVDPVKSPTYLYYQEYASGLRSSKLVHYDLYRFNGQLSDHDVLSIDLPQHLEEVDTIVVVEWGDKLGTLASVPFHRLEFRINSESSRSVVLPKELLGSA